MADGSDNVISSGSNTNPNADILFDIDTGEGDTEPEISTAQTEEAVADEGSEETPVSEDEQPEADDDEAVDEEAEEVKEEEKPAEEEKPKSKRKKPFVVNDGDETQKLSPDTTIRLTVDGKELDIPLHEVADSYNSYSANQKRYNELKTYEQTLTQAKTKAEEELRTQHSLVKSQVDEFSGMITNLAKASKEGKAILALSEILEKCDVYPLPVVRNIRQALVESAEQYLALSPEQRMILDAQEEVAYYRQREARERTKRESEAQERSRKEAFLQVSRDYGIPSEKAYNDIFAYLTSLKEAGQLNIDITPKVVGDYYQAGERVTRVKDAVQRIAPQLLSDEEFLKNTVQGVMRLDLSQEDLEEAIRLHVKGSSAAPAAPQEKKKLSFKPVPSKPTETGQSKKSGKVDLFL